MNADSGRGRGWQDLMLVARRELAVRVRGTAFRVSTILLLAVTVAGIAIAAALTGHPQRFTVAITAQSPPAVTALVQADAKAAGLQVTTVTATDRADAVRLVEQGDATAAVAADAEIIWKGSPDFGLQPVLAAAAQQAVVTQRAASLGLSSSAAARLLAPVQVTNTELHGASQRTARLIIAEAGIVLLYLAITLYGSYVQFVLCWHAPAGWPRSGGEVGLGGVSGVGQGVPMCLVMPMASRLARPAFSSGWSAPTSIGLSCSSIARMIWRSLARACRLRAHM